MVRLKIGNERGYAAAADDRFGRVPMAVMSYLWGAPGSCIKAEVREGIGMVVVQGSRFWRLSNGVSDLFSGISAWEAGGG